MENWKIMLLKDVAKYIFDFLIQSEGGTQYNNLKTKYIIKDILKKDDKKIQKTFILPSESELLDKTYEFLYDIFKNPEYFAIEQLGVEQEDDIWRNFNAIFSSYNNKIYVGIQSKHHLIDCINYHNAQIRNRLLDPQSILAIRLDEIRNRKVNNKLDKIITTLNSNTALQEDDISLDYMNEQLESILMSMKLELSQIRLMQIKCIRYMFILIISLGAIFVFGRINTGYSMVYITLIYVVIIFLIILLFVLLFHLLSEKKQKGEIDELVMSLYILHFNIYEKYLYEKIKIN